MQPHSDPDKLQPLNCLNPLHRRERLLVYAPAELLSISEHSEADRLLLNSLDQTDLIKPGCSELAEYSLSLDNCSSGVTLLFLILWVSLILPFLSLSF